MDKFIEQVKALFSTTTRRGRAIRTGIQGFIGLLTFFAGLLVIPGLEQYLFEAGILAQVGTFAVWIGVIAYIQNALEAAVKFLWGE